MIHFTSQHLQSFALPLFALGLLALVGCGSTPAPTPPDAPTPKAVEVKKDDPTAKVLGSVTKPKEEEDMFGGAVEVGDSYEVDSKAFKAPEKTKTVVDSKPELMLGTPIVQGKADRDAISLVASKQQDTLKKCFKKRIDSNGEAGTIIVSFAIKTNGAIDAITKTKSTLKDDKIDSCVLTTFNKMAFPKANNKAKVNVVFPVLLTRP